MNAARAQQQAATRAGDGGQAQAAGVPALVAEFLAHLAVERRMSAHTLDAYRRDLAALAAWAQAQARALPGLHGDDLRAFVAAEHRRGLSPKSLQRRLSACRSFYRWLLKLGRIAASPADAIRAPKAARRLPQVLDVDEAVQLVEVSTDAPLGLRDRAMLELLYSSGLRLSETCAQFASDLDPATQRVHSLPGDGEPKSCFPTAAGPAGVGLKKVFARMQGTGWKVACAALSIFMIINLSFTLVCMVRWRDRREGIAATTQIGQVVPPRWRRLRGG